MMKNAVSYFSEKLKVKKDGGGQNALSKRIVSNKKTFYKVHFARRSYE